MRDWQTTLDRFLGPWRNRDDTEASLLYGSYAAGNARPDSDLDLLILMRDGSTEQPPFLDHVDGILIEAFFLTPTQVRKFWAIHHAENTRVSAVQWIDGRILFDRQSIAADLKHEAAAWLEKAFAHPSPDGMYWPMRNLWQGMEHLRALERANEPSLSFTAQVLLQKVYTDYARAIGEPIVMPHRLYQYLTDHSMRLRYHLPAFSDNDFATRAAALLRKPFDADWLDGLTKLTLDVINRVGGFPVPGLAKSAGRSDDSPQPHQGER